MNGAPPARKLDDPPRILVQQTVERELSSHLDIREFLDGASPLLMSLTANVRATDSRI